MVTAEFVCGVWGSPGLKLVILMPLREDVKRESRKGCAKENLPPLSVKCNGTKVSEIFAHHVVGYKDNPPCDDLSCCSSGMFHGALSCNQGCAGAGSYGLVRIDPGQLFPAWHTVTSHWQLTSRHVGSIYTTETGHAVKQEFFSQVGH